MIRNLTHIASVLMLGLGMAGCVATSAPRERISVLNGSLLLAAPPGYCVDPTSRREERGGSFVLFGSCAAISGDTSAAKPAYRAMLSATVGPQTPEPLQQTFPGFARFFQSAAGRAALARSGSAQDVAIQQVVHSNDLLLLKIRDRSRQKGDAPVAETYWRAITALRGRITALSVLPMDGVAMGDAQQIRLLQEFDAAIRAANPRGL